MIPVLKRTTPLVVLALATACENAGVGRGFGTEGTSNVQVLVYLDRDGSRNPSILDTAFVGARIALLQAGSHDTLRTALTAATGIARFNAVPRGEYRLAVVPASLGDSIEVAAIDPDNVKLTALVDTARSLVRLAYPEVSLRRARALPAGKRVFVRGVVLAGVQSFRDTTSHLSDSSSAIRLTRVVLRGGLTGNAPGDSVTVLGVTGSRLGQPILDQAIISRFGARPAPNPLIIATNTAATASNGGLDAALVQIVGATISDTATVTPDFKVTVSDGSGSLAILLDVSQQHVRSNYRPGRQVNAVGVLTPDGSGGWLLRPRGTFDIVVF